MTADLPINESILIRQPQLFAASPSPAATAPHPEQWGRVCHHYGPSVTIGETNPNSPVAGAAAASPTPGAALDHIGQAGVDAFALRTSAAFTAAKAARPHNAVSWSGGGVQGLQSPMELPSPAPAAGAPAVEMNRLIGKVAVGVVIVSGPGALAFAAAESTKVVAEVQHGLTWLGSQNGNGVSFSYDVQSVTLDLADDPDGADKEGYWRVPTMAKLGYADPGAYAAALKSKFGTDTAYIAFFVKYSQTHFAYAYLGGPYLCMQYSNDGWGPDNIDRVFAHETGHIFNAPDEYSSSGCNCAATAGYFGVVNGNCESCANPFVKCIMASNDWSMCKYTPWHLGNAPIAQMWSTSNIGQGPGALAWLTGDVDGDKKTEIVQPWNNGGKLGMIVYEWNGTAMVTQWGTSDIGQGSGAVGWLAGDVTGDKKTDVVQLWNNGGKLGMIVYAWNGTAMVTKWGSPDMGQGSGAINWLVADVDGDGKLEVIQLWNNGGQLGVIVYGWNGSAMITKWSTANIGQGSGAVGWLVADVNGDGKSEIIQLWNNGGSLGMIVYGWNGTALITSWGTGNIGQGSGAIAWLSGDVTGDKTTELIQLWNNGGKLGMIVYGWNGNAMVTKWSTSYIGQGSGAVGWLIGDFDGDKKSEIVQLWNNGGKLGIIEYHWTGSAMMTSWSTGDIGQGSGAVAFLAADVNGNGTTDIVQQWANGGSLGTIVYGSVKPT